MKKMIFISVKSLIICLSFLLFLVASESITESTKIRCLEKEKKALVLFKEGLKDDTGYLSSWQTMDDCCDWEGVSCSNRTSHVIGLHLYAGYNDELRGKIGPSLLELQHLTYLDLSFLNSSGSTIPSFIGSLSKLKYLNLGYCGFVGTIPDQLGNLSNLQCLELRGNEGLKVRNLEWISRLSSLRSLDLSFLNGSGSTIPSFIGSLSKLKYLDLEFCGFVGTIPDQLGNLSNLQSLELRGNEGLNVRNLEWLSRLSSLRSLALNYVNLSQAYDWSQAISRLHFLTDLKLKSCQLPLVNTSFFPLFNSSSIFLSDLDLSLNNNIGLDLQWGHGLFNCSSLRSINLNTTGLFGQIPEAVGKLISLENLYLSNNYLEGDIPNSLWNLSNLTTLDLYQNRLKGSISEVHLSNVYKLESLDLSRGVNRAM